MDYGAMVEQANHLAKQPRNPARAPEGLEAFIADATVNPLWDMAKGLGAFASGHGTSPEAGAGMMAAMGLMSPGARLARGGIRAYHGSPYSFDKFDASKIGTGEGAQAYGHGLYFAGNEATAREYRRALAGGHDKLVGGKPYDANDPVQLAASLADTFKSRGDGRLIARSELLADIANPNLTEAKKRVYQTAADILGSNNSLLDVKQIPRGHMYEVNINAKPEQFLDWDRPLSVQNDLVRSNPKLLEGAKTEAYSRALSATHQDRADELWSMVKDPMQAPAGFAYQSIAPRMPGGARAGAPALSAELNEAGIPGIKYLDQGSRSAGEGTSNYVVFDPNIIEIMRKYGIAGAAAFGAGGAHDAQAGQ